MISSYKHLDDDNYSNRSTLVNNECGNMRKCLLDVDVCRFRRARTRAPTPGMGLLAYASQQLCTKISHSYE